MRVLYGETEGSAKMTGSRMAFPNRPSSSCSSAHRSTASVHSPSIPDGEPEAMAVQLQGSGGEDNGDGGSGQVSKAIRATLEW